MKAVWNEDSGDAELLAAIADGDWDAFRLLYDRRAPWLLVRLRTRCADPQLAEEVVQETFLSLWRSKGVYLEQDVHSVAGLLWRIAVRRLVDALRGAGARQRLWDRVTGRRLDDELSAEQQVLAGVEHGDMAGALARLSPELRMVLQATVLDGLSTREAARLLGIPAGTVKTRAMRARAQLREELA